MADLPGGLGSVAPAYLVKMAPQRLLSEDFGAPIGPFFKNVAELLCQRGLHSGFWRVLSLEIVITSSPLNLYYMYLSI